VAPGIEGTDAVNMSQLWAVQSGVNGTARKAYSGIAEATALAMIPPVDTGKHVAIGAGGGVYEGYAAGAVGVSVRFSKHLTLQAGVGISTASQTYGGGLKYEW
jgi:autotransporter adhesin